VRPSISIIPNKLLGVVFLHERIRFVDALDVVLLAVNAGDSFQSGKLLFQPWYWKDGLHTITGLNTGS